MKAVYYRKKTDSKKIYRIISLVLFGIGIFALLYVFSPLILWHIFFSKAYALSLTSPIPKSTMVNPESIKSLLVNSKARFLGVDYTNADNWFPGYKAHKNNSTPKISSYTLSIPKLNIEEAVVATTDHNLSKHLINYIGTAIPPDNGNAVIFGHSTLPQLFSSKDYKTIFATAYMLNIGDLIFTNIQNVIYQYKIFSILVVDPTDTSIFTQTLDNSYITLVTCTPPGTTWKRLIIKARLERI